MCIRDRVKNQLPESKPACPAVVSCALPRFTREDALLHRVTEHKATRRAPWAEQLAEAELSLHQDHTELRNDAHGEPRRNDFSYDDELSSDRSWMQQLAYDELIQWLRVEAKLTDKEIEALECRAAGVPVKDRHCLRRARMRALQALSITA